MSNIKAVQCDYCNNIVKATEAIGISTQIDAFDKVKSFPSVYDAVESCSVHLCMTCINSRVIVPLSSLNRVNENEYQARKAEMFYIVKKQAIKNYNNKKK